MEDSAFDYDPGEGEKTITASAKSEKLVLLRRNECGKNEAIQKFHWLANFKL